MKLVITDLDNTLYDWVTYFAHAFSAMVDALVPILKINRDDLLQEFRQVHQRYGNSEQPFAVLELQCVQERFGKEDPARIVQRLAPGFEAFNLARDQHLKLYGGVEESLDFLRKHRVAIVGHTESIAVNAFFRLRKLGVWHFLDHLYALEDRLPPHPTKVRSQIHTPPPGYVQLVPLCERKPNPELLLDICRRQDVLPRDTLYVGDSLTRDIGMAKQAGILAVWAKYGTEYSRDLWEIIVRVTHWSEQDVIRETRLREIFREVHPDFTIESFSEVCDIVETLGNEARNQRIKPEE